ncbi:hypothetical protein GCM10010411_38060 [Actinomadura fulvescens]|uniref:DUF5753 domain-containing protein n=1 Tax=Actinomadura fulvescens TaxID=46160 RepID=A0ABP6C5T8_9ACTN
MGSDVRLKPPESRQRLLWYRLTRRHGKAIRLLDRLERAAVVEGKEHLQFADHYGQSPPVLVVGLRRSEAMVCVTASLAPYWDDEVRWCYSSRLGVVHSAQDPATALRKLELILLRMSGDQAGGVTG